jgi:hypothetical protein
MIRWDPCVPLLAAVIGAGIAGACRANDPPPQAPSTGPATAPVRVTGTEKIAWSQAAANASQLAHYRYIVYVDDVPTDPVAADCSPTPIDLTFSCNTALPKLSPGPHRLQFVVEEIDGGRRHSPKSGPLLLDVQPPNTSR